MLKRIDQSWRRHHLKTLIEAYEKLRWNNCYLNGSELHSLDLSRNRTQLTCGINFALYPTRGISLDRGRKVLREEMGSIVDRGRGHLHDVFLFLRLCGPEPEHKQDRQETNDYTRQASASPMPHVFLPPILETGCVVPQLTGVTHQTTRLAVSLRGIGHRLIAGMKLGPKLGKIFADAGQRGQHRRLFVCRQPYQFAAAVDPALPRLVVEINDPGID